MYIAFSRSPMATFINMKSSVTNLHIVHSRGLMVTASEDKQIKVRNINLIFHFFVFFSVSSPLSLLLDMGCHTHVNESLNHDLLFQIECCVYRIVLVLHNF